MTMALLESTTPMCAREFKKCSEWARVYMKYCLCSVKDEVSLTIGLISVISWGIAEVPQILTNYKQKSTHGLSIAFLVTWIIGDLFNLFGCMLEPAALPTQYYTAMLYTMTTMIPIAQTIYYGHIYDKWKCNKQFRKVDDVEAIQENGDVGDKPINNNETVGNGSDACDKPNIFSSPIPFPTPPCNGSFGRELYYVSARSLSSSHTPTAGSYLAQRMMAKSFPSENLIEEPLLDRAVSRQFSLASNTKTLLCMVSVVSFLGTWNVHQSANNRLNFLFKNKNQGFIMHAGRQLFQVNASFLSENDTEGSSGIGTLLGWAMAVIYMGGRLPQICLNMKRGNVEGLNPLMFVFALIGNTTYVASILISSLQWSKIKPNLPWLVDAGGCMLLDTFILIQFFYFRYWAPQVIRVKQQNTDIA